jgi:hypothetical protein
MGQFVVESWLWGCGEKVIRFLMYGGKGGCTDFGWNDKLWYWCHVCGFLI